LRRAKLVILLTLISPCAVQASGGSPPPISAFFPDVTIASPALSPDGAALAFLRHSPTRSEAIVETLASGASRIVATTDEGAPLFGAIRWRRDGRLEVYALRRMAAPGGLAATTLIVDGAQSRPGGVEAAVEQRGMAGVETAAVARDVRAGVVGALGPGEPSVVSVSRDGRWRLTLDAVGAYHLYDRQTGAARDLDELRAGPPLAELGHVESFTFLARDGTRIPCYLTLPPQATTGPLPMVVMPHGGPMQRDGAAYDRWAQVIATRGYLVFQPNYRGSAGYGSAWLRAGYGQWGGRIQDDIVDGVAALVRSGRADGSRVCVFGASFGGYAALMQGALRPDLYKCVISWSGFSDLSALLRQSAARDGVASDAYRYDVRQIGDPVRDAARLRHDSPIAYAPTYGPPVLLTHGDADETIPADQSRVMAAALADHGRDVRLNIVAGEDHGGWTAEAEETALTDVVAFIEAHIAPAAP